MVRSKFQSGDHVVHKSGKHGDVKEIVDSMGTPMPKVSWRKGGQDTVFESEIRGTGQCNGRKGCPQG
jgi:hypothetical protein